MSTWPADGCTKASLGLVDELGTHVTWLVMASTIWIIHTAAQDRDVPDSQRMRIQKSRSLCSQQGVFPFQAPSDPSTLLSSPIDQIDATT